MVLSPEQREEKRVREVEREKEREREREMEREKEDEEEEEEEEDEEDSSQMFKLSDGEETPPGQQTPINSNSSSSSSSNSNSNSNDNGNDIDDGNSGKVKRNLNSDFEEAARVLLGCDGGTGGGKSPMKMMSLKAKREDVKTGESPLRKKLKD